MSSVTFTLVNTVNLDQRTSIMIMILVYLHNEEDDDDDVVEELLDEGALMIFSRTFLIFIITISSSFFFVSFDFVEDVLEIQIIEGENTSVRIQQDS